MKTQLNTYPKVMAERADRDFFMWKLYLDLISKLLSERKEKTLCDLGSGTGSLLMSFANEIDEGYGIDLSTEMTSIAQKKAETYPYIKFNVGDITNFTLPNQFSIIQCTDGVIPYLYDEDAIDSFLKNVYQNLLPDGIAVLEFWTDSVNKKPTEYLEIYPERLSIYDEILNENFQVEYSKFSEGDDCRYRFYYPDKNYNHTVMCLGEDEIIHRFLHLKAEDIRTLCNRNGFKIRKEYGLSKKDEQFYLGDFFEESTVLTLVLEKYKND